MSDSHNFSVFNFSADHIKEYLTPVLGESYQSLYLLSYLCDLDAKTFVVEYEYIDKDYLMDYSTYYARSLDIGKYTKRLHFFNESFDESQFKSLFNGDDIFISLLKRSYLGFVVVKPIMLPVKNKLEPLIGRTLLKTYPSDVEGEKRIFLTNNYHASLFGLSLEIQSLPFQAQDSAVAACATTAIWTSLFPLKFLFEVQTKCPFEITQTSIFFPDVNRNFPSKGLTDYQMKYYFNVMGLETEVIATKKSKIPHFEELNITINDKFIKEYTEDAIKAYLALNLPIIAVLELTNSGSTTDLHAVIISGYRKDADGVVKQLYVHDDQLGPYCKVKPAKHDKGFVLWNYELSKYYREVRLFELIIPLYSKIRLAFSVIYTEYLKAKSVALKGVNITLFLIEINEYKRFLLSQDFAHKEEILTKFSPKYFWVIRTQVNDIILSDNVYDATAIYSKKLFDIIYD